MRKMLNTLYIISEDSYLACDGSTIAIKRPDQSDTRVPMHNIEAVLVFSYTGASPALMGALAEQNIALTFLSPRGKFLARVKGAQSGNVLLRREQYRVADCLESSTHLAKSIIAAKIYNARWQMERTMRDHALRIDGDWFSKQSSYLQQQIKLLWDCKDLEEVRGYEGFAAAHYFAALDQMILNQKEFFVFKGRSRRPPMDAVNALLSFAYTLLTNDVAAALEANGLDAYVGFLHRDYPGRMSLALDIVEEFRAVVADRFVLTLINKKMIQPKHFVQEEAGAVQLTEEGRNIFLQQWQNKKQEEITHPFLKEKIPWGLAPFAQALLLSRFLRGNLDAYPAFLWK